MPGGDSRVCLHLGNQAQARGIVSGYPSPETGLRTCRTSICFADFVSMKLTCLAHRMCFPLLQLNQHNGSSILEATTQIRARAEARLAAQKDDARRLLLERARSVSTHQRSRERRWSSKERVIEVECHCRVVGQRGHLVLGFREGALGALAQPPRALSFDAKAS